MSNTVTPLPLAVPAYSKKIKQFIASTSKTICSMKILSFKTSLPALLLLLAHLFFANQSFGQATVTSDKEDYAPRSNAVFTGSGFAPNEDVLLKVKNLNSPCNTVTTDSSYLPWTVKADATGAFVTNWTVCDCPGDSLRLKATGQTSGLIAYAYFTDGNANIQSVSETIISPNNSSSLGVKDFTTITGRNQGGGTITNFELRIYPNNTASGVATKNLLLVGSIIGNSNTSPVNWDGKNASNLFVSDGSYYVIPFNSGSANTGQATLIVVDNTNPTISLDLPGAGATINGTVDFTASPLDAGGNDANVDKVEFYLDGTLIGSDASSGGGWKFANYNTGLKADGTYSWYSIVYDKAGNKTTSSSRSIIIANSTSGSVGLVSVGAQSGTLTYGTAGTPTYSVSSTRGGNGTVNGTYSVSGLPAGVTSGGFAPSATFTSTGGNIFPNAMLTLNVPATINAGSYPFTVNLTDGSNTVNTTATLLVAKAAPTVTVNPYSVTYDGQPHTSTYTITGVNGESGATVGTIDVSGTTHTNAGTYTGDAWSFTGAANYEDANGTVDNAIDKATPTITVNPYSVTYDGLPHTSTYTITGVNGESGATVGTIDVSGTTHTNAGTYNGDAWSFTGAANYEDANGTVDNAIDKALLTVTAENKSRHYGDPNPTLTVKYEGFVNGETLATSGVTGSPGISTLANPSSVPGGYAITVIKGTLAASNYNFGFVNGTLIIGCEEAAIVYTGQMIVPTATSKATSCNVILSATVTESGDGSIGNIANAIVKFKVTETGQVIEAPVRVVSSGVGTATATLALNVGSSGASSYTLQVSLKGGYYCAPIQQETLEVYVPGSDMITGGGYLKLVPGKSAGDKKGDDNSRNNFGFNVKYNKSGTNLQGHINTIIRRTENGVLKVYQVKSTAMTSLSTSGSTNPSATAPGFATYFGKGNIQDITNPDAPVSVLGNVNFRIDVTDKGEPGSADEIAITVWNKDGGLWYSSNWNGTTTAKQALAGGNVVVRTSSATTIGSTTTASRGTTNATTSTSYATIVEEKPEAVKLSLQAFPNPSENYFSVRVNSPVGETVEVRMVDVLGKVIQVERGSPGQTLRFGDNAAAGMYILEARQPGQREKAVLKVVKLN